MGRHGTGMAVGRLVLGVGRILKPLVPPQARQWMDDRFFSAVFQATRVTNDNYGYGVQEAEAKTPRSG